MMIRGGKEPLSVDDMIREAGDPWPKLKSAATAMLSGEGTAAPKTRDKTSPQERSRIAIGKMVGRMPAGAVGHLQTRPVSFLGSDLSSYKEPAKALATMLSSFVAGRAHSLSYDIFYDYRPYDTVRAVAAVLSEEYGIQPLVPHLLLMTAEEARKKSEGIIVEKLAERILSDPRKEARYQDSITRLLILLEARKALESFSEELSESSTSPFEQAGAILKFRNHILSWLWWSARIVDDYEIDWRAHPMPWELDES